MTPWHEGEVVDSRWNILKIFPKSGMGVVVLVERLTDGQVLVAKTLQRRTSQAQHDELCEFQKEVLLWISLGHHPHIAMIYFVDTIGGITVVLTEYYRGGDLADVIASGSLKNNLARILQLAVDFCEGMIHAHNYGLLAHRDIKPRNCLLDLDGRLVVTDFGLGKVSDNERGNAIRALAEETSAGWIETRIGAAPGTNAYMAPEQFRDLNSADTRSDVYSFGLMLYEMTTSLPAHSHPLDPVPDLKSIPNGKLRSVIQQCVEQNPEKRYPSFEPIRERLIKIYRGKTGHDPLLSYYPPGSAIVLDKFIGQALESALSAFGNTAAALRVLERMARQFPEDKNLRHDLAVSYLCNRRYDDAARIWEQAVAENPEDWVAQSHYGAALIKAGKARAAVRPLRVALALHPADSYALGCLGEAFRRSKRFKAALCAYGKVRKQEPNSAIVYNCIGRIYEQMGCPKEASEEFRSALARSPGHANYATNLARVLHMQGDVQGALRELKGAVEENPDSMELNKFLVLLLAREGNKDAARGYLELWGLRNIDGFDPEFPDRRLATHERAVKQATQRSGSLRDAFSFAAEGNIKEAIESFEDAETDQDIDAETYREFAMIMFEHGYTGRAFICARMARSREPTIQLPEVLEVLLGEYLLLFDKEGEPMPEMVDRFQRLREEYLANKKG